MTTSAPDTVAVSAGRSTEHDRAWALQTGLYAGTLVAFVCFAVTVGANGSGSLLDQAGTWVYAVTGLLAAAVVGVRARLDRRGGAPYAALATGLVLQSAGDLTWSVLYQDPQAVPFPSVSDWFYLSSYPCMYVAVVLLVRRSTSRPARGMLVDVVIGACGMSALALTFAYDRLLVATEGDPLPVVVGLAYPASDLLMLVVAAGVAAVVGLRAHAELWTLVVGIALWAVGDSAYSVQMASGSYVEGSALDLCWSGASCLFATSAVWWLRRQRRAEAGTSWWTVLTVPGVFAFTSLLLLGSFSLSVHLHRAAAALAVAAVLLALLRGGWTFREVSRLAEARLEARTDDLTGLLNRRGFNAALDAALRDPFAGRLSVVLMDLDRFKDVNDALGHHAGDALLRRIGRRIAERTEPGDALARLGGDEFAIVSACDHAGVQALVARVHHSLEVPLDLEGIAIRVGLSTGAVVARDGSTSGSLLQEADIAMYDAKRSGVPVRMYDAARDTHTRDRLEVLEQLRDAVDRDELVLHYQPKVDLATGAVRATEALVRWQHPTRGLLHPGDFLEAAEQSGLMRDVTATVLDLALRQVREWRDGGRQLGVAVNVTASNLLDVSFPDQVARALQRHGVPPELLTLELTETTLLTDPERGQEVVQLLRTRGIAVSIDDYGTGYSSLAYLQDLAVAELKLAREFVSRSAVDSRAEAIVRTSVDLAHSLGMTLVAEGVEDTATRDRLRALGCDTAQGYLFSPPLPPDQLLAWLDGPAGGAEVAAPAARAPARLVPVPVLAAGAPVGNPVDAPADGPADGPAGEVDPVRGRAPAALRRWSASALPHLARPLATDDHRAEFWVRHLRLGIALTEITGALVLGYVVGAHRPGGPVIAAVAVATMVSVLLLLVVPMDRWCHDLRGVAFFYAWSVGTTAVVGTLCLLDGGASSPLLLLMVIPMTYAGLAYPPLGVLAVGAVMVLTDTAVVLTSTDTSPRNAVQISMLVLLTVMIAWSSRNQWDLTGDQQRLTEELHRLADTDVLTGCLNRRSFDRRLSSAVVSVDAEDPLSICMIDLDGFKAVNDTYGHAGGDALLTWVAEGLRGQLRDSDVLARLGGDEFAALLPHTTSDEAREVAERLRGAVARIGGSRRVTASVGVVTVDAATDPTAVLTTADRLMYDAKRAGGDRATA